MHGRRSPAVDFPVPPKTPKGRGALPSIDGLERGLGQLIRRCREPHHAARTSSERGALNCVVRYRFGKCQANQWLTRLLKFNLSALALVPSCFAMTFDPQRTLRALHWQANA